MYIVFRTLSCTKCFKKGKKCSIKCTKASASEAQLMWHKCTLYIHRWRSNVHCTVHKMYLECTSDAAICCMYNVHKKSASKNKKNKKSASKKSLKVHCKY